MDGTRPLINVLLFSIAVFFSLSCSTTMKQYRISEYFPLRENDKTIYKYGDEFGSDTVITVSRRMGTEKIYYFIKKNNNEILQWNAFEPTLFYYQDKNLCASFLNYPFRTNSIQINDFHFLFPFKVKIGTIRTLEDKYGKRNMSFKVLKIEDQVINNTDYTNCMKIEIITNKWTDSGDSDTNYIWLKENLGIVKMINELRIMERIE